MPKESMTSRERWLAILNHQKPDRIPMDYWATPEATKKLMKYLRCDSEESLFNRLHIDPVITVWPKYIGSPERAGFIEPPVGSSKNFDIFGCGFKEMSYGAGVYEECIHHPLAEYKTLEEIKHNYKWPSPHWYDYSVIPSQIMGKENYPIQCYGSEPGWKYQHLRGHEQALIDFVLHPEIAHYCIDKIFNFCHEVTHRIYETIPDRVDLTYVAEDFGSQESLMYSPDLIREFFIPGMKRMINLAHKTGSFVFHHSDGAIHEIILDLVKAGIDILNPIQWRCNGMEREALKRDFGDKIVFHGAMDNQYTLAFGSIKEVHREVLDNLRILGKGGGYILAPCHNIQVASPPENIVTMYETGYENGWY